MEINVFDRLLYYLSHVGELSWEKFKDAVENLKDGARDLTEGQRQSKETTYLSILARFAHIDYDPIRLDRVFIAPPTIVETADRKRFVLVGSRTPDFLKEIAKCVSESGVKLEWNPKRYAPTTIVLSELPETSYRDIESLGIQVSCAYSAKLSSILPSPERRSFLKYEAPPLDSISKFDFKTLEFKPVNNSLRDDGLYEIPQFGRNVYVLKTGSDERRVPRDWGVWLFLYACDRTAGWISYEPDSQTWGVNRKLLVPLLVDRCATLCSGFPPYPKGNWWCYADVPVGIAFRLTKAIYQNWEVV